MKLSKHYSADDQTSMNIKPGDMWINSGHIAVSIVLTKRNDFDQFTCLYVDKDSISCWKSVMVGLDFCKVIEDSKVDSII